MSPPTAFDPDSRSEPGPRNNPFQALRAKLGDRLPSGLEPVARQAAADPSLPRVAFERVTVRRERAGRGGKTVTLAEGPGLAGRDLAGLAREIGRALGLGARAEPGALILQGDQRERLAAWLTAHGFERVERGN